MMAAQTMVEKIRENLSQAFSPTSLDVIDESHLHAGHAGARPGGESHFRVEIVSSSFEGQSRVARQRDVYKALASEMAGPIHALALTTRAPSEVNDNT
jgi:BolA protein